MIPHYFAMSEEASRRFAMEQAAGTLVTSRPEGTFDTTFLPIIWNEDDRIIMHIGRANTQWQDTDFPRPAVLVFTGAHGFVSALDYDLPDGMVSASTWDYTQVSVHGTLHCFNDAEWARAAAVCVQRLHDPEVADALTDNYLRRASRAIVGLRLDVERIEGIAKLSQNKLPHEREAICARLVEQGTAEAKALAEDIRAAPSKARRVPFTGPLKARVVKEEAPAEDGEPPGAGDGREH
ncbi:MAG: FMN-binding negative transcriptional regulator [Bowdeniella nasicola]|nr:FMN-binding negative transcriptional regulator [Bowdeniella nasicola]